MKPFKADLHIHTVLSPCGDLSMSPANIVNAAYQQNLNIIGIADHNSTRHCRLISRLAAKHNIFVLCGAEVTSKEEVHCLCFLPDFDRLNIFQAYLDAHLPEIKNDPEQFGYQVQVDEDENIIYEEPKLLISAIDQTIDEIERKVHELGGLFIPAHVNRSAMSLISQLGFIPDDLQFDALEIYRHIEPEIFLGQHPYLQNPFLLRNSDAHFIDQVGTNTTSFLMEEASFVEIKKALRKEGSRNILLD
jgi:PHP family Zn ribbon phosphoesterase